MAVSPDVSRRERDLSHRYHGDMFDMFVFKFDWLSHLILSSPNIFDRVDHDIIFKNVKNVYKNVNTKQRHIILQMTTKANEQPWRLLACPISGCHILYVRSLAHECQGCAEQSQTELINSRVIKSAFGNTKKKVVIF